MNGTGSDRYANDTYDSNAGQSVGGQSPLDVRGGQNDPAMAGTNARNQGGQGQQMSNGEYLDHEEEHQKKGFSKFIEFITCRCA